MIKIKNYVIVVNPEFVRDSQIALDTQNLNDDELHSDLHNETKFENCWFNLETKHFIDVISAENSETAIKKVSKKYDMDSRILEAIEIKYERDKTCI